MFKRDKLIAKSSLSAYNLKPKPKVFLATNPPPPTPVNEANFQIGQSDVLDSTAHVVKKRPLLSEIKIRNETVDVLLKIFHTPHFTLKLYLFLFVVTSSSLAAYMVIETILNYLAYEVSTTSRTVFETPTLFPRVTICNANMFTSEASLQLLKMANTIVQSDLSVFDAQKMALLDLATTYDFIRSIILVGVGMASSKNFTDEQRQQLGHDFKDILLSCTFNYQPCSVADFIWTFDPTYGNCYVFNSGFNSTGHKVELRRSSVAGSLFGLQIKYYAYYHENLTLFNSYHGGTGALIRIDNSSYKTDHNLDGIRVSTGFQTNIAMQRAFKFTMPKPYSNCEVDENSDKTVGSELYKLIAASQYEYTQQLCFEQCYQKQVIEDCNCTAGVFNSFFNVETYQTFEAYKCCLNVFTDKYTTGDYIQRVCVPQCPLECNSTEYKATTSSSRLPGELHVNYVKQNQQLSSDYVSKSIDGESVSKSILTANIFYDSLSFTHSSESPQMTLISLLANIGGHLGLFLGISLFSLGELVEVFMEIVLNKIKK